MSVTSPVFTLSVSIAHSLETVWRAWTDATQLKAWLGPAGCPITESTMNLTIGGRYHYAIAIPDGSTMWARWNFLEISSPHLLVWEHQFTDATGEAITRHPYSPTWPLEMISTLTLHDLGNATQVTLSIHCVNATPEERATFTDNLDNMHLGWGNAMAQLQAFLQR